MADLAICLVLVYFVLQKPHNEVRYKMTGSDNAKKYFVVNEVSGEVYIKKPLYEDADSVSKYTVSLRRSLVVSPSALNAVFLCLLPGLGLARLVQKVSLCIRYSVYLSRV